MNIRKAALWSLVILLALVLGACGQLDGTAQSPELSATAETAPTEEPTSVPEEATPAEPRIETAEIESLEVVAQDQSSQTVTVRLRGVLPNDCARIEDVNTVQDGSGFRLTVLIVVEPGEGCSAEAVPFEETIDLAVAGLEPGTYSVSAGESQVTFELVGATPEEEPTEEPQEAEATAETGDAAGAISGLVWHDLCANIDAENAALPSGCVLTADNEFLADGALQAEEGIADVEVSLGEGSCPATAVESSLTDAQGAYIFSDLAPGTYCLFIDMTRTQNQGILGSGFWTFPASDSPAVALTLGAGETLEDQNFGWDFLNLPLAEEADLTDCTNSIEFVTDLNIPDDTAFTPGEAFSKAWQLRNNGTCPWSTAYSVVFVGGDLMSAEESIPLEEPVAPGETFDVAVDMVAPEEPGTYRGNWQVADANGQPFGIDGFIGDAFWLQIVVSEEAEPAATAEPNSAAVGGVVWDEFCINSDPGQGCVESPADSGIFIGDGTYGANEAPLTGVVIGLAGEACPTDGTLPSGSAVLETTRTDDSGQFIFEGLTDGTYCVFMDALNAETLDLLIPGNWTWPASGVGQYTVVLDPGEQRLDLDFGWDYIE